MANDKTSAPPKPKTDEQVAQEYMSKFLAAHEFAVTRTGGKVYADVFDVKRWWWLICKINGMKPKLPWPPNVEIRHPQ